MNWQASKRRLAGAVAAVAAVLAAALAQPAAAQDAAPAVAPEYKLGIGDVVRIAVFQNQDLSTEARINESGSISYPLLGAVKLAGLGIPQAEKTIADGLKSGGFVRAPQVTITVLQIRANLVSVLGQVAKPGRYPVDLADTRVSDMLSAAGGVGPGGSDIIIVTGTRDGKPFRLEVDQRTLFTTAAAQENIVLQGGDSLWVDRMPIVYVYGEVQRPGPMRLERDMTLMQALATGGGVTPRGTTRGIKVHRKVGDQVQELELGMTDKVQEGDVVFVRESLF